MPLKLSAMRHFVSIHSERVTNSREDESSENELEGTTSKPQNESSRIGRADRSEPCDLLQCREREEKRLN